MGKKVALVLFIVLFAIFILLILGIPRLITAWRTAEVDVDSESEPGQDPDVLHLPAGRGADPDEDDLEATWIGQREP